ncbi:MAG: hypothetical protein NC548_31075 [Lachnospiraceae bacterium]|nr:hypothetical protein [Lachnospiraceae bacterium]MCM1232063.1 hypothetical protein [Ruminococcus flavefaciens]
MFTVIGTLVVLVVELFVPVILPVLVVFVLFKFFFANSDEPDKRWGE